MLIKYAQKLQPGTVDSIRERMTARYAGADNAFKTLVLDQGADATVIGNSLSQMDFSGVSAVGTERILAACEVPGVLVGLEPLRGAGRGYQESMQKFANIWARPAWRSACGALSQIVDVPAGNRLWFDTADIAALQDGEMERAQAALVRMQAVLAGRAGRGDDGVGGRRGGRDGPDPAGEGTRSAGAASRERPAPAAAAVAGRDGGPAARDDAPSRRGVHVAG